MTSKTSSSASSGGIGFFGLLAILFIALKLLGYIKWSWWWVLAPIWMPLPVILLVAIVGAVIYAIWPSKKQAR